MRAFPVAIRRAAEPVPTPRPLARRRGGRPVAVLAVAGLIALTSACAPRDAAAGADATTTSTAPATTATTATTARRGSEPAKPRPTTTSAATPTPAAAGPAIELRADGLGDIELGLPRQEALTRLEALLGPPDGPPERLGACTGSEGVSWRSVDLDVIVDEHLQGWVAGHNTTQPLRTASGLHAGMTVGAARGADPGIELYEHPSLGRRLGTASTAAGAKVQGSITGFGDKDTVSFLFAGFTCQAD